MFEREVRKKCIVYSNSFSHMLNNKILMKINKLFTLSSLLFAIKNSVSNQMIDIYNRLCSVVVSSLAFRSEIAGSNPVFGKLCSLFNFLIIYWKEVRNCPMLSEAWVWASLETKWQCLCRQILTVPGWLFSFFVVDGRTQAPQWTYWL